ncbi:MAG: ABC transporter permease [Vicinamibacteria bacterium]|jgi:putative ABC transport system permease protein|nr:ABC transporter permease [Vicinamibacteria bacterium]
MALPITYNVRNVRVRWQLTLLAIVGIALVVTTVVFLTAMASGFRLALRATGRTDNVMIVQKGANAELTSGIGRNAAALLLVDSRIARDEAERPLSSPEILVVATYPRKADGAEVNVSVRGVTPRAFDVRGGIRLVAGRQVQPGLPEVMVGERVRDRYGFEVGSKVSIQNKPWEVVGVFASDGSGFESEIWGDLETMAEPLRRTGGYQAVVVRLADPSTFEAFKTAWEGDPQVQVSVFREREFYEAQAGPIAGALLGLAGFVGIVMGVGAVFGAMNTMYGIVASRTREIGTLRALGFSRRSILLSFLTEAVILAAAGGVLGCLLALPANGVTAATNSANFSELAFAFRITAPALFAGMTFAILMGIVGGLLPALRAARLPITTALREV